MKIKKALRFPFLGEGWFMNFFISFCFTMTYFYVAVFPGYSIQIIQDLLAAGDKEISMPSWNGLGKYLKKTLIVFVIQVVYKLPSSFLWSIFSFYYFLYVYPYHQFDALLTNNFFYIVIVLSFIYEIIITGFSPTIYGQYAQTNQITDAFNLKKIFFLTKKHFWKNIYAMIVLGVLTLFAFPLMFLLGVLTMGVGLNAFLAYVFMVRYHLIAQLYQETIKTNEEISSETHESSPSIHVKNKTI